MSGKLTLRWLVDLVNEAEIERLVIDGSFVTDAVEPNDVDCICLIGSKCSQDNRVTKELLDGLPFLDLQFVMQPDFDILVDQVFATDRDGIPKGMVEVIR